jgi:solute carrier organic anion transporter family, member 5A
VVLAIPVGHYGSRGNKARLTAAGFCAINVSLLLFALPHFVTPKYEPDVNGASDRIECNPGGSEDECVARSDGFGQLHPVFQRGCVFAVRFSCPVIHKSSSWVIIFFIVGQLWFAACYSPLISLASTYLQENVEKYSLALYLAWLQGAPCV